MQAHDNTPEPASDWRTQSAIVFVLLTAVFALNSLRTDDAIVFSSNADWLIFTGDEVLRSLPRTVPAVLALQAIERLPALHPQRTVWALVAMLAAAWVGSAASAYGLPYEPVAVRVGASASTEIWFWFVLWNNVLVNLVALVVIDGLRSRHRALRRLVEAQQQGRIVRQQLAHSQLLAIQARVDPQLLFDTLAAVRWQYDQDPERAERLLDELTAFLRAALPRLRSARSTLEIEFGLAEAYVRLLRGAGAGPIDLQLGLSAAQASLAFPAGVLLPLLAGRTAGPRTIEFDAQADQEQLRVRVLDNALPAAATLDRLRASLQGLYGASARLHTEQHGASTMTLIEVPLEPA